MCAARTLTIALCVLVFIIFLLSDLVALMMSMLVWFAFHRRVHDAQRIARFFFYATTTTANMFNYIWRLSILENQIISNIFFLRVRMFTIYVWKAQSHDADAEYYEIGQTKLGNTKLILETMAFAIAATCFNHYQAALAYFYSSLGDCFIRLPAFFALTTFKAYKWKFQRTAFFSLLL